MVNEPSTLAAAEPATAAAPAPVIAVIGGSGKLGRAVTVAARAAGADVRVLTRSALRETDGIAVVTGDATKREDLARALKGADAVISVVGPVRGGPRDVSSRTSLELLHVCRERGPRRLVMVTGAMVGASRLGPFYRGLRALVGALDGGTLADRVTAEKILMATTLDWTIVRPPRLDDRADGAIEIGTDLVVGARDRIGRAALARKLVALALGGDGVRQAVVVRAL